MFEPLGVNDVMFAHKFEFLLLGIHHSSPFKCYMINTVLSFWYRLENEHLNNAGKFRAVKIVPLPFHEVDEED